MKIIPKGYVREKNNNPVSFDELGNLTDQITGEKGTMMLPGFTVTGISPETRAKNYSTSFDGTYGLTPRDIYGLIPVVGDALDLKDIGTDLYLGNYLRAGIGAGMFLLPNILERPLKATGRFLLNKNFRNKILKQAGLRPHNTNDFLVEKLKYVPRNLALRESKIMIKPDKLDRLAFIQNFERELKKRPDEVLNTYSLDPYISKILRDNPEYTYYISTTGKDPSLQSTVDDFIRRLETSLRGVYSPDKNTAIEALTSTLGNRPLVGGDRLRTNGGLYTSNSFGIAEAFKNPQASSMDGYIGTLLANFNIDRNLPIDELLRQIRNKSILANNSLPLFTADLLIDYLNRARKRGGIALEALYARRDGSTLPVHERAYLPTGTKIDHPVKIVDLQYFPHSTNKAGRWGTLGVAHSSKDEELFIPRMLNNTTDFIDLSRTFLKGIPTIDYNKADILTAKYSDIIYSLIDKLGFLRNKVYKQLVKINDIKNNIKSLAITGGVSGGIIGGYTEFIRHLRSKNTKELNIRDLKISAINKSSLGKEALEELDNDSTIQTWEEYDKKLDLLYKKYNRILTQNNTVLKHQQGGIVLDNTRVWKPLIVLPFKLSAELKARIRQLLAEKNQARIYDKDKADYYRNLLRAYNNNFFGYGVFGNQTNYDSTTTEGLKAIEANVNYTKDNITNFGNALITAGIGAVLRGILPLVSRRRTIGQLRDLTKYKIGLGAEAIVINNSPITVGKITTIPKGEMTLRNSIPNTFKSKFVGYVKDKGNRFPTYVLRKAKTITEEDFPKYIKKLDKAMKKKGYEVVESPDILYRAYTNGNLVVDDVSPDNIALNWLRKPKMIDFTVSPADSWIY